MTAADDSVRITRYLLHEVDAQEQEEIEGRYFSDPEYLALLEAVEDELIHSYVRGELSRRQQERFEKFFLCTRARRDRLRMAEAMQMHFVKRERGWTRMALAIAASLIVAVALGVWYFSTATRPAPPVVVQRSSPPPVRVAPPVRPPVTLAATLMPGLTRAGSAPQKIVLRPDVDEVRFNVVVDVAGEWPDLRASLGTWTTSGLTMNADRTVSIAIPAVQLTEGEHVLVLTSRDQPLGDYAFVVERD